MIYDLLAPIYDEINSEINYKDWADFIDKTVTSELGHKPELTLDLGAGTGRMSIELASRGYDMIALDYSGEMLNIARERAEKLGLYDILFLMQDMREFELYGTVELIISCLDSINHLTSLKDLKKCFSLVHNYLSPDGIFIFDINGREKFERAYGKESYVMETENSFCVWQNWYDEKTKICDFYITLFAENSDGSYQRYDEEQRERMYKIAEMKRYLIGSGFEFIGAYSDFDYSTATDKDERIYIVARCKKD